MGIKKRNVQSQSKLFHSKFQGHPWNEGRWCSPSMGPSITHSLERFWSWRSSTQLYCPSFCVPQNLPSGTANQILSKETPCDHSSFMLLLGSHLHATFCQAKLWNGLEHAHVPWRLLELFFNSLTHNCHAYTVRGISEPFAGVAFTTVAFRISLIPNTRESETPGFRISEFADFRNPEMRTSYGIACCLSIKQLPRQVRKRLYPKEYWHLKPPGRWIILVNLLTRSHCSICLPIRVLRALPQSWVLHPIGLVVVRMQFRLCYSLLRLGKWSRHAQQRTSFPEGGKIWRHLSAGSLTTSTLNVSWIFYAALSWHVSNHISRKQHALGNGNNVMSLGNKETICCLLWKGLTSIHFV